MTFFTDMPIQIFFVKSNFNVHVDVLALSVLKDNNVSSAASLTVDTVSFDKFLI